MGGHQSDLYVFSGITCKILGPPLASFYAYLYDLKLLAALMLLGLGIILGRQRADQPEAKHLQLSCYYCKAPIGNVEIKKIAVSRLCRLYPIHCCGYSHKKLMCFVTKSKVLCYSRESRRKTLGGSS